MDWLSQSTLYYIWSWLLGLHDKQRLLSVLEVVISTGFLVYEACSEIGRSKFQIVVHEACSIVVGNSNY